jgi:hypothetical protein
MLVKGPTGAPERKPFDTRHECSEREWFVVSSCSGSCRVQCRGGGSLCWQVVCCARL